MNDAPTGRFPRPQWFTRAAIALLAAGCAPTPPDQTPPPPFVFRTLNLRQQDSSGRPLWELTSPETRYDLSRRVAQARDLRGVLYRDGQPLYRFTASNGVVLNDGEVVQLEGPTRVQRLESGDGQPLVITALRVRWYPARKVMELDRSPVAVQKDLRLSSRRVRFLIGDDRLELRGRPLLQRGGDEPLRLEVTSADWLPGTGALTALGPVRGERAQARQAPQTITAPSLTANTRRQIIDLQGPVRVVDPAREGELTARSSRIDLPAQSLSSDAPFVGRLGKATLEGAGFRLDFATTTAVVTAGCRLSQPGDRLSASRCLWNWTSGAVEANGGVTLRRTENDQITRAQRLRGQVAANGFVQFGGGGSGRVTTQLRIPEGGTPAAPDRGERPKRPPIEL